jgi:hypothetical protein
MAEQEGPSASATTDKAQFLRSLAPLFPDVRSTETCLQAIEAAQPGDEHWMLRHMRAVEDIYFPLWQAMAPAYVATLAAPFGADAASLRVSVKSWPATVAAQQQSLHFLLTQSRLRQSWRDYARWFVDDHCKTNDQAAKAAAEAVFRQSSAPLREIPLYMGYMRVACQQLVCLPLHEWQALHDGKQTFTPQAVDSAVVERLATRVAEVFNSPPLVDVELLRDAKPWDEPVVWTTNAGQLTGEMDCHGMRDRCEHGWRGEEVPQPPDAPAPHWRYEGFCGHLCVTLENGHEWIVAVLAPVHFLRRLAYSVSWYQR